MAKVHFLDDDTDEAIITVRWRFLWLFTCKPQRFRGSCTVWHDADTGRRASTCTEAYLADIWTKARWEARDAKRKAQTVQPHREWNKQHLRGTV